MTLPNFFIIGGVKCGTTSLYRYLQQHPEIYMPRVKEPQFFAYEGEPPARRPAHMVTTLKEYVALFDAVSGERAIGEASPTYLYYSERVAPRIRRHVPNPRLIACLRNPVERAFSQFQMAVKLGKETCVDFAQGLRAESSRVQKGWGPIFHYTRQGFYYEHLRRYMDLFGRDRVRVYLLDDFARNPISVLQDIFRFLGVDDRFIPKVKGPYNSTRAVKSERIQHFLVNPGVVKRVAGRMLPTQFRRRLQWKVIRRNLKGHALPPDEQASLVELYREDVLRVSDLIGRDLSPWLAESRETARGKAPRDSENLTERL